MARQIEQDVASVSWHLDRRIPLAMILAILAQTVAAMWFLAGLHYRLVALETRQIAANGFTERLVRVEQGVGTNTKALERIERTLERVRFSSTSSNRFTPASTKSFRRRAPLPSRYTAPPLKDK